MTTTTKDLNRAVQAARGIKLTAEQKYCEVCDEPLVGALPTGRLCWACQFRKEARDRRDYEDWA